MYSFKWVFAVRTINRHMPLRQCRMRCKAGGFSTGAVLRITFGTKHSAQKANPEKYLLNICEFVYFVWAYLIRNAVAYDCVNSHADAYRPCAEHLLGFYTFMSKGVIVTKNDIFHKKYLQVGQQLHSGDGSVG